MLAELDGLKRNRATQSVGEKAQKAIRFIKGMRQQGSVLSGVTVSKTIIVQMITTKLGIPVKLNAPSEGKPNGIPG